MTQKSANQSNSVRSLNCAQILRWALVIFVLALVVRVVLIRHFAKPPFSDLLWGEAVAWNLITGHGFTASSAPPYVPGVFRSPGHPVFVAAVYLVAGRSYSAVYLAQSVLDALTAVLLFLTTLRLLPVGTAVLSGILYSLYPYSAIFCGIFSQDILLTFAVALTLWLAVWSAERTDHHLRWSLVGLALGAVAMVKPFLILYGIVPAAAILVSRISWRSRISSLLLLCMGTALVISPWMIRDYSQFHTFVPLSVGATGSGLNNVLRELDEGDEKMVEEAQNRNALGASSSQALRNLPDGEALILRERELARQAGPELRRRWPEYLLLIVKHLPALWITRHAIFDRPFVARLAQLLSYLVLLPGLGGMILLRQRWRELLPLFLTVWLITVIYAPAPLEARYTLPARPVMVMFVAVSLSALLHWLSRRLAPTARAAGRPAQG